MTKKRGQHLDGLKPYDKTTASQRATAKILAELPKEIDKIMGRTPRTNNQPPEPKQ